MKSVLFLAFCAAAHAQLSRPTVGWMIGPADIMQAHLRNLAERHLRQHEQENDQ